MGVVSNQSFKNMITTYVGFAVGGLNAMFLYTRFLSDTYYGLVSYVLATAGIMMPLMTFGVHNTLVKFYSTYTDKMSLQRFLTLMLFLPLVLIIPIGLIGFFSFDWISELIAHKNPIAKDYIWHIYGIAMAMAYFEIFFAWAKVHYQTVFGTFLKEVLHRVSIMVLLLAVYFKYITTNQFLTAVLGVYVLRMLIMKIYAYRIKRPVLVFKRVYNWLSVLKYASLIIVAGSIATIILDIDKFMLGQYISIHKIAYYSVATYMATVIIVPQRAMHQILLPLTAELLNRKNYNDLKALYQRSSLVLFIISGLIFMLIVVNCNQLYCFMPEAYKSAIPVVVILSIVKLYDSLLGSNNAILFNSNYYRKVLAFGLMLAVLMVILNIVLIPIYGLLGAAIATFLAVSVYNTIKIVFVKQKFGMYPFTTATAKVLAVIICCSILFCFWDFTFNPLVNIILKSALIVVLYSFVVIKLKVSKDLNALVLRYLKITL